MTEFTISGIKFIPNDEIHITTGEEYSCVSEGDFDKIISAAAANEENDIRGIVTHSTFQLKHQLQTNGADAKEIDIRFIVTDGEGDVFAYIDEHGSFFVLSQTIRDYNEAFAKSASKEPEQND